MRVAGRGHIKGFLVGRIRRSRLVSACAYEAEQAAAKDRSDLLAALLGGQSISDRMRHGSSPGSGQLSGVYLPGAASMCRNGPSKETLLNKTETFDAECSLRVG